MTKMKMVEYYMELAYEPERIYERFINTVPEHLEINTLVGVGLSGGLVVPTLARTLGMDWLVVRKDNDGSHSVEPSYGVLGDRWLFVDDCVASGRTIARALAGVEKTVYDRDFDPEWVGVFLYQHDEFHWSDDLRDHPPYMLREYLDRDKPAPVFLDDLTIHDDRENLKESGPVYDVPNDAQQYAIKLFGGGTGGGGVNVPQKIYPKPAYEPIKW